MSQRKAARAVAWCAFVLGCTASVAANVAHAKPELGPRLASAFAPVALLLTVEIMSRVPWPQGWRWALGRWAGAGVVALVAAITSYGHMYDLLRSPAYGETQFTAMIQPACVDGLMVVASLALLALGHSDAPSSGGSTKDKASAADDESAGDEDLVLADDTPTTTAAVPAAPAPVGAIPPMGIIRPAARVNGAEVAR